MKNRLILLGVLTATLAHAQTGGLIALQNAVNNPPSSVSNAFTGTWVTTNDAILVQLYVAPDLSSNEDSFTAVGAPTPVVSHGRYGSSANLRTVDWALPGAYVMIEVRAFETAYGNSYTEALGAPPMNGRRALVGKSQMASVRLGGILPDVPPLPNPSTSVCGPITVDIAGGGAYLSVKDIVASEGSNGVFKANFKISLSLARPEAVSVDFATKDASALAGLDYIATNGTVTFSPGETTKTVTVLLTPDDPGEGDEIFFLALSNPVNGFITRGMASCIITEVRITGLSVDTSVSFNTVANRRYAVERFTPDSKWVTVTGAENVLGTGNIVTILDRGSGCQSMTLYRARLVEE